MPAAVTASTLWNTRPGEDKADWSTHFVNWAYSMKPFHAWAEASATSPRAFPLNTSQPGSWSDFQQVRFGLASALLYGGYYQYRSYSGDTGNWKHWFDEYSVDGSGKLTGGDTGRDNWLGKPLVSARQITAPLASADRMHAASWDLYVSNPANASAELDQQGGALRTTIKNLKVARQETVVLSAPGTGTLLAGAEYTLTLHASASTPRRNPTVAIARTARPIESLCVGQYQTAISKARPHVLRAPRQAAECIPGGVWTRPGRRRDRIERCDSTGRRRRKRLDSRIPERPGGSQPTQPANAGHPRGLPQNPRHARSQAQRRPRSRNPAKKSRRSMRTSCGGCGNTAAMNILVPNLGSTSLKYQILEMPSERVLARERLERVQDYGEAITQIRAGRIRHRRGGFQSGPCRSMYCGTFLIDDAAVAALEAYRAAAPAHNGIYLAAIRAFREALPGVPLVAAFETEFHTTMPEFAARYGVPREWLAEHGVRRYGFHGERRIGSLRERVPEILGRPAASLRDRGLPPGRQFVHLRH